MHHDELAIRLALSDSGGDWTKSRFRSVGWAAAHANSLISPSSCGVTALGFGEQSMTEGLTSSARGSTPTFSAMDRDR